MNKKELKELLRQKETTAIEYLAREVQENYGHTIIVVVFDKSWPYRKSKFKAEIELPGQTIVKASGSNKRKAKEKAAMKAILKYCHIGRTVWLVN